LVPAKFPKSDNPNILGGIHEDVMFDMVMNKFQWGNMDYTEGDGIYMDENNRRMTTNLRLQLSTLAEELIKADDFDRAQAVLDKTLAVMPEKNVPYDRVMIPIVDNLYAVGSTAKADEIAMRLFEKSKAEMEYYFSLEDEYLAAIGDEPLMALSTIANLDQMTNLIYNESEIGEKIQAEFKKLETQYELQIAQGRIRGEASF